MQGDIEKERRGVVDEDMCQDGEGTKRRRRKEDRKLGYRIHGERGDADIYAWVIVGKGERAREQDG